MNAAASFGMPHPGPTRRHGGRIAAGTGMLPVSLEADTWSCAPGGAITSLPDSAINLPHLVLFEGVTTIVNSARLAVSGGFDLVTAAGDIVLFSPLGASGWRAFLISQARLGPVGEVVTVSGPSLPAWLLAPDGAAISRATYANLFAAWNGGFAAQTFTVTIASPGVVTKAGHGFLGGERVRLSTTGALPTGLGTATDYFVISVDANTFRLASSKSNFAAGTAINTSGGQSGTHSYLRSMYGLGDGATTFNMPDWRDDFLRIAGAARGAGTWQQDAFQGHQHTYGGYGSGSGFQSGAGAAAASNTTTGPVTDGSNGTPRAAAETRPVNTAILVGIRY